MRSSSPLRPLLPLRESRRRWFLLAQRKHSHLIPYRASLRARGGAWFIYEQAAAKSSVHFTAFPLRILFSSTCLFELGKRAGFSLFILGAHDDNGDTSAFARVQAAVHVALWKRHKSVIVFNLKLNRKSSHILILQLYHYIC